MSVFAPGQILVSIGDYWSAGDKGRSSQPIPGMGSARHRCAVQSFKIAQRHEIPTHFVCEAEDGFVVEEFTVPNHEPLSGETAGEVLNGEWIWRLYLMGSLWDRVERGELDPRELGFAKGYTPKKGERLPRVHLECTTKYETIDRRLTDEEARDLMKLSIFSWHNAWELLTKTSEATDAKAYARGFCFPDGKGEIGRRHTGELVMVDTFGTPDENRVLKIFDQEIYSKDLIRNYLKEVGYWAFLKAAQQRHPNDTSLWPNYPRLPDNLVALVSQRYTAFADAYCYR